MFVISELAEVGYLITKRIKGLMAVNANVCKWIGLSIIMWYTGRYGLYTMLDTLFSLTVFL
jgi:hypothetical protein